MYYYFFKLRNLIILKQIRLIATQHAPDIEDAIKVHIAKFGVKLTNKPDTKIKPFVNSNLKEKSTVLEDIVNNQFKENRNYNRPETLQIKLKAMEETNSVYSYNENQIPTNDYSQIKYQNRINKPETTLSTQNMQEKSVNHTKHQFVSNNSYDKRTQPDSQEDSYSPNSNYKKIPSYLNDRTTQDSNESIDMEVMIDEKSKKSRELNLSDVEKLIE